MPPTYVITLKINTNSREQAELSYTKLSALAGILIKHGLDISISADCLKELEMAKDKDKDKKEKADWDKHMDSEEEIKGNHANSGKTPNGGK